MKFYSAYEGGRPVRLSEGTRKLAYDSLHCKYGKDAVENYAVPVDDVPGFSRDMDLSDMYDLIIREICSRAPVRICEGELLSGSANLGLAIKHAIPATAQGNGLLESISHLTVDFPTLLREGIVGIEKRVEKSKTIHEGDPRAMRFLESCNATIESLRIWHGRYLDALKNMDGYEETYRALCRVPENPPTSFREALQSIWFVFAFLRLCGNWPGIGRIDVMLGDFLSRDLEAGIITPDEARELIAHFFIKGCEWITGDSDAFRGSGDAQHYQNIVLSGVDENGHDVTNEVTYLILDVIEELGISDFPTTVRLNKNTDPRLLRRMAEVIRHGGGVLAMYCEETVLSAMTDMGYPLEEARLFANDGCWEVQVPGKTYFSYFPFDSLAVLQHDTLEDYSPKAEPASFEELYSAYIRDLGATLVRIRDQSLDWRMRNWRDGDYSFHTHAPCTAVSLFEGGCIERGLSYVEGGADYNIVSPHIGGLPDTANSLYAIKKMVFDDGAVTFGELMEALRCDFEGYEPLRLAAERYSYFGCDNDEVDLLCARILDDFAALCDTLNGPWKIRFPAGVSTFGRQIEWRNYRLATPFGRKKGAILAANLTPTPGTDKAGATAIIRSYCKSDLTKVPTGAALDLRLLPSDVRGEDGISALVGLMMGFVNLGGFFMQPDVADVEVLRDAVENPEDHKTLSVRVSGWNARFVTLNREWQNMIIGEMES